MTEKTRIGHGGEGPPACPPRINFMYSSRRALLMVKWFEKTLFYFNILSCHRCSQKDFRMQIQELAVVTGNLRVERRMDYQQLGVQVPAPFHRHRVLCFGR